MYGYTPYQENLPPGACDICGALRGHEDWCLDEEKPVVRQHTGPLFSALWGLKGVKLDAGEWMSVLGAIVMNVVIWADVLEIIF